MQQSKAMTAEESRQLIIEAHSVPTMEDQIRILHRVATECYVEKSHIRMARYTHDVAYLLNKIDELRAEIFALRTTQAP
jgi:hypothetical protein